MIGLKPIFEEERQFLSELLGLDMPTQMWRKAHALYLDMDCEDPYLRFKVEDGKARITRNNTKKFSEYEQKGWQFFIDDNKDRLDDLVTESVEFIKEYILSRPDVHTYVLGYSSGKDSIVTTYMWLLAMQDKTIVDFIHKNDIKFVIQMANTSNDVADTYHNIQQVLPEFLHTMGYGVILHKYKGERLISTNQLYQGKYDINIIILNPEVGYYQWIMDVKDYFIPTIMVRSCCSTYKEGQTDKFFPNDENIVIVSGVRKFESAKRAKYTMIMDDDFYRERFGTNVYPKKWVSIAPILNWYNEDIWLFLLDNPNIPVNPLYKLGFHRVG